MTIERHDINGTPFKELKVGTVFLWNDMAHLKIRVIFDHQGHVKNNAIRLSDGCLGRFVDEELIHPRPNARLVVE